MRTKTKPAKKPVKRIAKVKTETIKAETFGVYKDNMLVKTFSSREEAEQEAKILGCVVK